MFVPTWMLTFFNTRVTTYIVPNTQNTYLSGMKKFFLFCILATALSWNPLAAQTQLADFETLMSALNGGAQVRLAIHYGKCKLVVDGEEQEKSMDAVGGMPVSVYEYFARGAVYNKKAFVVASTAKLIANPLGEGFVYNYAKLRVYEDGEVQLLAQYVDPKTFEIKMSETFHTVLNDGKNEGAAYLFRSN